MRFFLALCLLLLPALAWAAEMPFTGPSNWGGTGLLEIPTGRVLPKNKYRMGISQADPYRYYYGCLSPFHGLEIDGRITEILGTKITDSGWGGYGNDKDKSLDLKYQFFPETKYLPAMSLGIMDPHGTRLYSAQYFAFSKQIFPFDFTIGIGNGRFGKKPLPPHGEGIRIELLQDTGKWLSEAQLFGGIEFAPSERFSFILEYSPIRYHLQRDAAQRKYFAEPAASKFNIGLRWKPNKWGEIDFTYQRGNSFGLNLSMAFDIGRPLVPIYDHPYKEKKEDHILSQEARIEKALLSSGFSNTIVQSEGPDIRISCQNDKYFYTPRAWEVILNVVSDLAPGKFEQIHIVLTENDIPLSYLSVRDEDLQEFRSGRLSQEQFFYLARYGYGTALFSNSKSKHKKTFTYGLRPSLETFLNDPSGFFRYRLGVSGSVSCRPWSGGFLTTGLATYPLNNVSSANEPFSIPVRSDIVQYKKENLALERLMFDQIKRITPDLYGRLSGGLLEIQYAGMDGELAVPLLGGRILAGINGSLVKKRSPSRPFALKENDVKNLYSTAFFNVRINFIKHDAALDVKAGKFLAGDKGARITLSKNINGVVLYAWYSFTDTSVFTDSFNSGYHDKGFGVIIPVRLFEGKDNKSAYHYSLSPWTRDAAQDIAHYNGLFGFIGRNTDILLNKDLSYINE